METIDFQGRGTSAQIVGAKCWIEEPGVATDDQVLIRALLGLANAYRQSVYQIDQRNQAKIARVEAIKLQRSQAAGVANVAELGLPARLRNILYAHGINTLADLVCWGEFDLLGLGGVGRGSVRLIAAKLADRGLTLFPWEHRADLERYPHNDPFLRVVAILRNSVSPTDGVGE